MLVCPFYQFSTIVKYRVGGYHSKMRDNYMSRVMKLDLGEEYICVYRFVYFIKSHRKHRLFHLCDINGKIRWVKPDSPEFKAILQTLGPPKRWEVQGTQQPNSSSKIQK